MLSESSDFTRLLNRSCLIASTAAPYHTANLPQLLLGGTPIIKVVGYSVHDGHADMAWGGDMSSEAAFSVTCDTLQ